MFKVYGNCSWCTGGLSTPEEMGKYESLEEAEKAMHTFYRKHDDFRDDLGIPSITAFAADTSNKIISGTFYPGFVK